MESSRGRRCSEGGLFAVGADPASFLGSNGRVYAQQPRGDPEMNALVTGAQRSRGGRGSHCALDGTGARHVRGCQRMRISSDSPAAYARYTKVWDQGNPGTPKPFALHVKLLITNNLASDSPVLTERLRFPSGLSLCKCFIFNNLHQSADSCHRRGQGKPLGTVLERFGTVFGNGERTPAAPSPTPFLSAHKVPPGSAANADMPRNSPVGAVHDMSIRSPRITPVRLGEAVSRRGASYAAKGAVNLAQQGFSAIRPEGQQRGRRWGSSAMAIKHEMGES